MTCVAAIQMVSSADVGRNLASARDLLRQSRDRAYAMTRILHYQQSVRGKEG